jgi:endoglucanase
LLFSPAGKLPPTKRVAWRGDSGLRDGLDNAIGGPLKDLVGGYYDAGDNIKFTFPGSYAMTVLSWSVIEYKTKYIAANEYVHVRELIKWGTDYLFKTFNYTVNSTKIDHIFAQVRPLTQFFISIYFEQRKLNVL